MSGPYRFQGESAKSPLERSSSPFSAGQPVSFKTNVNRAKTKKWVTAKKNAYDGDDWGGYDEYDEYGVDEEPAPAPAPSQRYYAAGQPQRTYTDRSFTEPVQPGPPGKARRNSFEAGEEHRAFSASIPPPQQGYGQPQYGEEQRQTSGAGSDMGHEPQNRRDFTPSAMPPPLQTHVSPMPSDINSSPARTQFPPRKSSIGQTDSPNATSPRPRTGSQSDKPLPFVRPADIYKRVEEERERERASLDSSRPSLDSLSSRPKDDLHSPTSDGGRHLQPLETVAERKSEYLPDFDSAFAHDKQPAAPGSHAPVVSPPNDQGFRSVVDQAFTRNDDQRSIPPTPISKDDDSSMSRTTTNSTIGISPIMSRVPSGATSAVKRAQAGGEGSTPAIAEEPSDTAPFVPGTTSTSIQDPSHASVPKPFIDHSRNLSNSSLPRSGLATPTRGDSPARSPAISPQRGLPEPRAAQLTTDSPESSHTMEGGLNGPSPEYATREADIATAAKSSPVRESHGLGVAEQRAQDAFVQSHAGQSPVDDAFPRSRSESPSKGRVQALAGKFGDVSHSRRGSTQSNLSRNSVQSWEKSQHSSRAPSPTKGSPSKPSSPVKEFRPHLPGQWESYATTAATPLEHGEQDKSLGYEKDKASTSLEGADLTPTTAKHRVEEVSPDDGIDPIAALKSAGAAMAQSFKATVGMNDASSEPHSEYAGHAKGASYGDMYMPRPLQLERTVSSLSSIPPTPPAKDTPRNEEPPLLPSKDEDASTPVQHKRPEFFPQLSTQPSADDQESDRLRKEIVASLTPVASADPSRRSLQPVSPDANRASSILPAEYDSYWADGGSGVSPQPSHETDRSITLNSSAAVAPIVTQAEEPPKPSLLNRFSWENNTPQLAVPDNLAGSSTVPEPTKISHEDTIPSPAIERAAEEERQTWSEGLPEPSLGAGHSITVTQPDSTTQFDSSARFPTVPVDTSSLASPTREHTRSPGLHVVNSAVDPEAVDLPPRLSADIAAQRRDSQDDPQRLQQELEGEKPNPAVSAPLHVPDPQTPTRTDAHAPSALSPTSGKPLDARGIATIGLAAERIATYNQTREHWATEDHGLGNWLASALDANPDLASQTIPVQRVPTGTMRHKHTASLALLGKLGGSSTHQLGNEQSATMAMQNPVGTSSPASGAPGSAAAFDRRVASRQLEAKGKDLLHTANVLSGKGLTSAKGLFAKGKSRFGREKAPHSRTDSMPSSREASEEPEFMVPTSHRTVSATTTTEKSLPQLPVDTDSPRDGRKKRRFSITSFRRSSRSRSRPNSIVLPSTTSLFSSTPKGTPPREVSRILGEGKSRPHTYHAPDSWNIEPPQKYVQNSQFQSTPPREQSQSHQSRLGILPSPAKSAFSAHERDNEQDIPPVPRIPDKVRPSHDLSHEVLQSVIRYATPPIPAANDAQALAKSPVLQHNVHDQFQHQAIDVSGDLKQSHVEVLQTGNAQQHEATSFKTVATPASKGDTTPQPEWPLVSQFQHEASVSPSSIRGPDSRPAHPSRFGPTVSVQPAGASVFRDLRYSHHGDLAADDQPPRLSYDPIQVSSEPTEHQSLPSYLIPSHLDVSDEEDYGRGLPVLEPREHGPMTAPQASETTQDTVDPLLGSTESPLDQVPKNDQMYTSRQATNSHDYFDTEAGAQESSTAREPISSGSAPSSMEPVSLESESESAETSQFPKDGVSLDAGPQTDTSGDASHPADDNNEVTSNRRSREQASSPAPVWFASDLRPPKMRAQGAADAHTAAQRRLGDGSDGNIAVEGSKIGVKAAQEVPQAGGSVDNSLALTGPHVPNPRRVSAAPQTVHAVQEYCAASDSSFTSWDRNSASAKSVSGNSQPGDMRDESDLVTPVAQVPRIVQHGQADKAEHSNGKTTNPATPNGYFGGHEIPSPVIRLPQQQSSDLTVPERSKSMLSMISSMVSEGGTPISPASSNAGRSTPSTIRRMHHDTSGRNPTVSDRIPEESLRTNGDRTSTGTDDDFDLYADHNGIVKDLRDASGQPLQLSQDQTHNARDHVQPSKPGASAAGSSKDAAGEDRPRYSTERPMSFISGPTDQDGRPQDQVNQPLKQGSAAARLIDERPVGQNHLSGPASKSTVYSALSPAQTLPRPNATKSQQPNLQHSQAQVPAAPDEQSRGPGKPSVEDERAKIPTTSAPRQQPRPASASSQQPSANGHTAQPGAVGNRAFQDPRMYDALPRQPMLERPVMQGQMMAPGHDSHFSQQQPGMPPRPRNEYELQQQRMQFQGQYHQQAGPGVGVYASPQTPPQHISKDSDKLSSLPKLPAVFKGLGGKLRGNNQQNANVPNAAPNPTQHQVSVDPPRNASYHSGVSSLQPEQPIRSGEQSISSLSPNRPPSNGAESHFSHASQGSTYAQPTHSRVDLRKPASPMPFQGIPPQILPDGPAKQNGQPQAYRASTSGVPEPGKKKRFSTLGNIFSRGNEPRLSKEQKKAQKAQRQSTPAQMQAPPSQWPPQHPQFKPQQNGMPGMPYPPGQYPPGQYPPGQYQPQQMRPTGPQFAPPNPRSPANLQGVQGVDPYGPSQRYQQAQPRLPSQQGAQGGVPNQGSAYMSTRQLAEQHQAQRALAALGPSAARSPQPGIHPSRTSVDQHAPQSRQTSYGPPSSGYYDPKSTPAVPDQGAYKTTQAERQTAEQQHQQLPPNHGALEFPSIDSRQRTQYQQTPAQDEDAYRALHAERLRLEQIRLQLESEQRGYNSPKPEQIQQQQVQLEPRDHAYSSPVDIRQQPQREQVPVLQPDHQQSVHVLQQGAPVRGGISAQHEPRSHQEQEQLRLQHSQQNADRAQPAYNQRAVSGPLLNNSAQSQDHLAQRHVSSPIEPQYETPQIPAAYRHVSGAFISPLDREHQSPFMAPSHSTTQTEQHDRQYSEPRMQTISPQISAQSQMPPNNRTHSDASTVSVVSPIGSSTQVAPTMPSTSDQRGQKARMSSISEVQQGTSERPWHLNFPEGATEQEIVRARQKQFMQQQFTAREQQHAGRAKQSPSPRASPHSPSFAQSSNPLPQQQGGGFKELLPRGSPQPYPQSQTAHTLRAAESGRPAGSPHPPLPVSPRAEQAHQPAAYPLPMSPDSADTRSPANPLASALPAPPLPPPKLPHSPTHPMMTATQPTSSPRQQHAVVGRERYEPSPPQDEHYSPAPPQESSYGQTLPDEPPPSYDGPGIPNDGMDKNRPEQPRPPNITTDTDIDPRGRQEDLRPRQPSIGILQHPQPASMAASPQRSSADMGAESLRRQLLQQEEFARMERIQRAQIQRAESEREKQERDAARARARELERSVSGGATVGSIRSVGGSRNGGQPGWERRGSTSRQVFELPAVEDDEPAMRATSYPGQEWVPQFWTDD